ncbi:hypothetical protein Csa_014016 [Cucumis sativus]|nr:hypothetical protein Csa_014016 [Cucumis sativus]
MSQYGVGPCFSPNLLRFLINVKLPPGYKSLGVESANLLLHMFSSASPSSEQNSTSLLFKELDKPQHVGDVSSHWRANNQHVS